MKWSPQFMTEREVPVERDPGIIDLTPETVGDREAVKLVREWRDAKDKERQAELAENRRLQEMLYGDEK